MKLRHSSPISVLLSVLLLNATVGLSAQASSADPALDPTAVNVSPGPEYGDAHRPFQGIPGIARAPNGRLWVTWYAGGKGEGPENYVLLATSNDDGRTWSGPKAVVDPSGAVRAYDPVVWIDPQGRLWWCHAESYGWWDGRAGVWALVAKNPGDETLEWSSPRRIADGIMMDKPTVLQSGDWLFPISIWAQEPTQDTTKPRFVGKEFRHWDPARVGAHIYRSTDHGGQFSLLGTVQIPNPQFDEHSVVERRDHSLWLLARNRAGIVESNSTDGGVTWVEAKASSIPHISSRFFVRRLRSGRLVLVKHNPQMDTAWLAGKTVPTVWQQRSNLTAYLSDDDGRTWQGGLLLDDRVAVAYPDADEAPDGRVFLTYDYNRNTDREILLATFTEEDILAKHLVSSKSKLRVLINKASGPGSP